MDEEDNDPKRWKEYARSLEAKLTEEKLAAKKLLEAKDEENMKIQKQLQAKDEEKLAAQKLLEAKDEENMKIQKQLQAKDEEKLAAQKLLEAKDEENMKIQKQLQAKIEEMSELATANSSTNAMNARMAQEILAYREADHERQRLKGTTAESKSLGEVFGQVPPPLLRKEEYRPSLLVPGEMREKSGSGTLTNDEKYATVTGVLTASGKAPVAEWDKDSFYNHLAKADSIVINTDDGSEMNVMERLLALKVSDEIENRLNGDYGDQGYAVNTEVDTTMRLVFVIYSTFAYCFDEIFRNTGFHFRTANSPQGPSLKPSLMTIFRADVVIEVFNKVKHAMIIQETKLAWKFPNKNGTHGLESSNLFHYHFNLHKKLTSNSIQQTRTYMAMYHRRFGIITSLNCFTFLRFRDDEVLEVSERFWIDKIPDGPYPLIEILFRWIVASLEDNIIRRPIFLEEFLSEEERIDDDKKDDYLQNYRPAGFNHTTNSSSSSSSSSTTTKSRKCMPSCWLDLEDPIRSCLTAEEQLSPLGTFERDAKLLTKSRIGDVYVKEWDGVKIVCKLLATTIPRDDDEATTEELILEMRREVKAYIQLEKLQGDVIPVFVRYGPLIDGFCDVLATEYAGEPITISGVGLLAEAEVALGAIHALGVSHGDLSNEKNILINPVTGGIVLVDFGFAKFQTDLTKEEWMRAVADDVYDLGAMFETLGSGGRKRSRDTYSTDMDDENSVKRYRF